MLEKSEKFGTFLTVGPRLKRLISAGVGNGLLWNEKYPAQEEGTSDGRGEFQHTREWIETASLERIFDLWCRGNNLIGFSETMLHAVRAFDKEFKRKGSLKGDGA